MKNLGKLIFLLLLVSSSCRLPPQEISIHGAGGIFIKNNVSGSFLLYDHNANQILIFNKERCRKAFLPASTFKIFISLVAIETGIINNSDFTLKWDKITREYDIWNKDHNLKTAIRYSVIWYFREIARRIGNENMKEYIKKTGYGNYEVINKIDNFWLEGDFKVNSYDQIELLEKLYFERAPFNKRTYMMVKNLLLQEDTLGYKLYAKSGFATNESPQIRWWIGILEQNKKVYFFALNIENNVAQKKRIEILLTKEILKKMGLYHNELTYYNN